MYAATEIHFADQEALKGTLVENLKRVRPTRFLGVPRVWEKIAEKMQEVGKSSKGVKKALATWAKKSATNYHTLVRSGTLTPDQIKRTDQYFQYWLAKKLILSRIHEALGLENATLMPESTCSSAALLNVETFMYFQSLDIVIYELLGCTESVAQTTNTAAPLCKPGSAGQAYVGVHNTILNPDENGIGEIATKSRNVFMGYHRDEVKTKEAVEDGWFKSGDLGKLDEDQFLWMCGRLKELIITAGGENIAPLPIENNIVAELSDILSYVIVIGDTRKYLSCLITLKCKVDQESGLPTNELEEKAVKWCNSVAPGSNPVTIEDFKRKKLLQKAIQKGLERANEIATANPCKVQKFTILPEELSVQGGELGPTLKLKRHAITTKYQNLIDEMYAN
jgi:long-chain-fatty-acid--CoA ligase ACSBG